jgi:molybdopterin molybdotransferase
MISEEQALAKVLAAVQPLDAQSVDLLAACGRFSAADLFAALPSPAFDNSSMDGYAVDSKSCGANARLKVAGAQPAGADRGLMLRPGEAIRVFTGAPIPRGADAVIMQEDVRAEGDAVVLQAAVEPGENIRRQGSDLCTGQKILAGGERIAPGSIGMLASQGIAEIRVGRAPRVAILSTGDELALPGAPLTPGKIYESNSLLLAALVAKTGAAPERLGIAPDEPQMLGEKLRSSLEADVLIVSGGVSVGEHDLVKAALKDLGAELDIWRVSIKPGKPFLFGQRGRCRIFGLPGNPVSSFVTFLQFVRPAILKMMGAGANQLALPAFPVVTASELSNPSERPHYVRGRVTGGRFTAIGRQESHALFGLSQSNALVRVGAGERVAEGARVDALVWD